MAKDKNSFVLYANYINIFKTLTKEQAGDLIILIFDYVNDLNPEEPTDQAVKVAWAMIKNQLKDDLKRYEDKRNQNRANVNKRYQKNSNEYENVQTNTNVNERTNSYYDNVNVNVNDNVNDIDNVYLNKEYSYIDNVNKEIDMHTHELLCIELTNNIKEVFPEMSEESFKTFVDTFDTLLKNYSYKNINISVRHAIDQTLEKSDNIKNPLGYLRNAIYINCEQFKNERG